MLARRLRGAAPAAIDDGVRPLDTGFHLPAATARQPAAPPLAHYWWSADGVRLHAHVWGAVAAPGTPVILCLPGLTRNARDFAELAAALAPDHRVIAIDFRGRGDSGYARDPMTYVPLTYVQDIAALLAGLAIDRFAVIGTSLGGLVAMLLAGNFPGRFAGAVLNDVGPELAEAGLARIRSYVGVVSPQPTWLHAARQVASVQGDAYPQFALPDWLAMVHRTHRLTPEGRIVPDYDPQIAAPLRVPGGAVGVDLWPAFRALGDQPLVILRGEHSDILAPAAAARMADACPAAQLVEVAGVGHAPLLSEPAARAAIIAWAGQVAARQ